MGPVNVLSGVWDSQVWRYVIVSYTSVTLALDSTTVALYMCAYVEGPDEAISMCRYQV